MDSFNSLHSRIHEAPKCELDKLEQEVLKTYGSIKKDAWGKPVLDHVHFTMLMQEIEQRRTP